MQETQSIYFDPESSISLAGSRDINHVLSVIAERYMAQNPPNPFRLRVFHTDSFPATGITETDSRYDLNLSEKFPEAPDGSFSFIAARFKREHKDTRLLVNCYGPVLIYLNGEKVWHSSVREDVNKAIETSVELPCNESWNFIVIRCQKTASGFGCMVGPYEPRWRWLKFLAPFKDRQGQGGFIYSENIMDSGIDPASFKLDSAEKESGLKWLPRREWSREDLDKGCFDRLYGNKPSMYACGWTTIEQSYPGRRMVSFELSPAAWYLNGEKLSGNPGEIPLDTGTHELFAVVPCSGQGKWDLRFKASYAGGQELPPKMPGQILGAKGDWLYIGPFNKEPEVHKGFGIFDFFNRLGEIGEKTEEKVFWRVDEPNAVIRPYLENPCFGRWNYPLGVTLYGLTQTARVLNREDISTYIGLHMNQVINTHQYSLWDSEVYGYPEINNQLVGLEMLDDCGSFGSAMLEYFKEAQGEIRNIADRIADHISNKQERREDGAFFRLRLGHWMENTLWVDDLYMCIPFLCRYAKLSGDPSYIDEAVLQVKCFRKYLFIPEHNVMSHVYDFKYGTATKMPWGRGNGWCLFSLSELLEAMPEDHRDRQEILEFFTTLCEGYLKLQGSRGLWHQFLIHPDSYEETSCTAMFIYAFCRALRFGWIKGELADRLYGAAKKGWQGICEISVDQEGNIFGVCMGSSYSFTPDYYKNILTWVLNDTHGTGIVLLAGIEIAKLDQS